MLRLFVVAAAFALVAAAAAGSRTIPGGYDDPSPPPASPPAPPPAGSTASALVATVGPSFAISLKTASGARVRSLKAGRYAITVRDRSRSHDFHLSGRGVDRKTGVAFKGTARWNVTFRKGSVYRFRCDPHAATMRGSFRAR